MRSDQLKFVIALAILAVCAGVEFFGILLVSIPGLTMALILHVFALFADVVGSARAWADDVAWRVRSRRPPRG